MLKISNVVSTKNHFAALTSPPESDEMSDLGDELVGDLGDFGVGAGDLGDSGFGGSGDRFRRGPDLGGEFREVRGKSRKIPGDLRGGKELEKEPGLAQAGIPEHPECEPPPVAMGLPVRRPKKGAIKFMPKPACTDACCSGMPALSSGYTSNHDFWKAEEYKKDSNLDFENLMKSEVVQTINGLELIRPGQKPSATEQTRDRANKFRNRATTEKQKKDRTTEQTEQTQISMVGDNKIRIRWRRRLDRQINFIKTINPEGLNSIDQGGWEEIMMYVDSGATETVVGENMLTSIEIKEGVFCRQGVRYEIANGETIPNIGEKRFKGVASDGSIKNITAQVCDVNKSLLSVSKAVKAGNKVVFDDEGSYIQNKLTGEMTWLTEEGGMYALKLWVKKAPF